MAKKHVALSQVQGMPDLPQRLEVVAIADLKPHPQNYQEHPEEELAHLRQSLMTHGQYKNIVIARDGTILAGHGVVEAATQVGWTHIAVERRPYAPEHPEAIQILVGDNELARLRIQDAQALAALLHDLQDRDPLLLLGTGFNAESLKQFLQDQGITPPDFQPVGVEQQGRLDEKATITCPNCGAEFTP